VNQVAREIFEDVLTWPTAWDKKTGKLRFGFVIEQYNYGRECKFMDEVYWPRMMRAMHLIKLFNIVPEWAWGDAYVNDTEVQVPWVEDADWADMISERLAAECTLCSASNKIRATYIGGKWDNDYWRYEEFTAEEILREINIRPKQIPDKVYKSGVVQASLF